METVTQDGARLEWTAVFWRHGAQCEEAFDSSDEALRFLMSGEDYGTLSSEAVLAPDGSVLYDADAIWAAFAKLP